MTALFIYNQHSRRGDEAAVKAIARLRAGGLDVVPIPCREREHMASEMRARAGTGSCVVACGGDGTMNAAANAMAGTGLPLGVIPAGTANDLARTLELPLEPEAAADIVLGGIKRTIDLGEVNGVLFFNVASMGLSTELARSLSCDLKRRWGRLGYLFASLRVLLRARPFRALLAWPEGEVRVRTYQIAVGNGRFYGSGMAVEEDAAIDDGQLDLYSLELRSLWRLAPMLPAFRRGSHGHWDEVRTASGSTFEVATRRRLAVNADGELVTYTPAQFRVRRAALEVFVVG